jgi:hypothetical protein
VQGGAGGRIKLLLETENDKAACVAKRGERIGMDGMYAFWPMAGRGLEGGSRYADGKASKRNGGIVRSSDRKLAEGGEARKEMWLCCCEG